MQEWQDECFAAVGVTFPSLPGRDLQLIDVQREAKEKRLMAAVDQLNLWGGSGTVRVASTGIEQRWAMRRERMSPCYTTRLEDVPMATI